MQSEEQSHPSHTLPSPSSRNAVPPTDDSRESRRPYPYSPRLPVPNPAGPPSKRRRSSVQLNPATSTAVTSAPSAVEEYTTRLDPLNAAPVMLLSTPASYHRASSSRRRSDLTSDDDDDEDSIRYTRTGRVSRATKGQRVHQCECGKIYTRAEHLRRHQQNHKNGGAFPCDVTGCDRSFFREDLLLRHKASHTDSTHSPLSRRQSSSCGQSEQPPQSLSETILQHSDQKLGLPIAPKGSDVKPKQRTTLRSTGRQKSAALQGKYNPVHELSGRSPSTGDLLVSATGQYDIALSRESLWQASPSYSPTGFESPAHTSTHDFSFPAYYAPFSDETIHHAQRFVDPYGPNRPCSPGSPASSSVYNAMNWDPVIHPHHDASFHLGASSDSEGSHIAGPIGNGGIGNYYNFSAPGSHPFQPFGPVAATVDNFAATTMAIRAEHRDALEHDGLLLPFLPTFGTVPILPSSGPVSRSRGDSLIEPLPFDFPTADSCTFAPVLGLSENETENRYLVAYWASVHPFYPILHRPTFHPQTASPLLRAAILALGAYAAAETGDKEWAGKVHERCGKILKKRTLEASHTYRDCDLQAILLVEVFAVFLSRRPPLELSHCFEDVYQMLSSDPVVLAGAAQAVPGTRVDSFSHDPDFAFSAAAIAVECKQRLLLTCFLLDRQHSLIFGRKRCNTPFDDDAALTFPWPRPLANWDAVDTSDQHLHPERRTYMCIWHAVQAAQAEFAHPHQHTSSLPSFDVFQSLLLVTCLLNDDSADRSLIVASFANHPAQHGSIRLAAHTLLLCRSTPLRSLLAVAGESWVMAEKLSKQSDYASAQKETREWATRSTFSPLVRTSIETAWTHALHILHLARKSHRSSSTTTSLHHDISSPLIWMCSDWALHLAAIVVWVKTYLATPDPSSVPRSPTSSSISSPAVSSPFAHILAQQHLRPRLSLSLPSPTAPRFAGRELEEAFTAVLPARPSLIARANGQMDPTLEQEAQKGEEGGGGQGVAMTRADARIVLLWAKNRLEGRSGDGGGAAGGQLCGLVSGAVDVLGKLVVRGEEDGWFG